MKVLLTGFVPFLDYPINPTEEVVRRIEQRDIERLEIVKAILPVDFNESAEVLVQLMDKEAPDAVVMLGLAAGRSKMTPERIAINVKDGDKDNSGYVPEDELIDVDGPDGMFATLPIRKMVNNLKKNNYPASISNTAGTYLCNNMMYVALNEIRKNQLACKAGFIHIPASHELAIVNERLPSWSIEDLTNSVDICLRTLI